MRRQIGLLALLGILSVFVVSAPVAGADIVGESATGSETTGESPIISEVAGESPTSSEVSPDSMGECQQGYMCIWVGPYFTDHMSAWPGSNTGCHNHENYPSFHSAWNRTGYTVRIPGWKSLASGESAYYAPAAESAVCWP